MMLSSSELTRTPLHVLRGGVLLCLLTAGACSGPSGTAGGAAGGTASGSGTSAATGSTAAAGGHRGDDAMDKVNLVSYDKSVWLDLLRNNTRIRRTLTHTATGLTAVTESDDPAIAAKIIDHAKSMQARLTAGAPVRVWDPVFKEMFKNHGKVKLEVTPTEKGVSITESSDDPETLLLLRSHAMGVSEFVRSGTAVAGNQTARFKAGDALPPAEVVFGGVSHRLLLAAPDAAQLEGLKRSGAVSVLNFRKPAEHPEYNEQAAVTSTGMTYCNMPYAGAEELTDELLTAARGALRAAGGKGEVLVVHCRSGNRLGPIWAAYRALDMGVPVEQAISEAKALRMRDAALEKAARDYIRRQASTPAKGRT